MQYIIEVRCHKTTFKLVKPILEWWYRGATIVHY